jgi:hypothetical protein
MSKKKNTTLEVQSLASKQSEVPPPKKIEPPKLESAPIKAWKDENGKTQFLIDREKGSKGHPFKELCGVKDVEISETIILRSASALSPLVGYDESMNLMIQSLNDIKPKDSIEARLVAQATVAFQLGMDRMRRAAASDRLENSEAQVNMAIKLMRVHNETIEALNRYRRGGEQKVTVTHIAEKMAVVNNYGCQGGGEVSENRGDSPCSL